MIRLPWLAAIATVAASLVPAATAVDAANSPVVVGDVPTVVGADTIGDMESAAPVRVQLVLRRQNQAALDALLSRAAHPRLTATEMGSRFGPARAAVSESVGYLNSHGFSNIAVSGDQTLVEADAPASAVQAVLGTRLRMYKDRSSGKTFHSNVSSASLPASLAKAVEAVHGLSDRPAARRVVAARNATTGPSTGYTPDQLKALYKLQGGALAGADGAGVTIGLMEFTTYNPNHITTYDQRYFTALPPRPVAVAVAGGADPTCCGNQLESELDIEVVQAIAPQATIRVYEAPNNDVGQNAAYNAMVSDRVNAISTSWGLCEQQTNPSELDTLNRIFQGASAQGINAYAATGDSGAYDCRNPNDPNDSTNNPFYNTLAVDSPASDPNVIGVGGTTLLSAMNNVYASESGWSGGGGGLSTRWDRPAWQPTVGGNSAWRELPDVAFDGDPSSGVSVYTYTNSNPSSPGGWTVVGGTSVGAPAWAAFNALYNQSSDTSGKCPMDRAAPALYAAPSANPALIPYHDVLTGSNGHYFAGPGFDLATGLGSMNGSDLASALQAGDSETTPEAASVTPATGSDSGGTDVTVKGCSFARGATVSFGSAQATSVNWVSPTTLQVKSPPHGPGSVDVTISNPDNSSATLASAFRYYKRSAGHQQLVQSTDGRLNLFETGDDGRVYHKTQNQPSGTFGGWTPFVGAPSSGTFVSDPGTGPNADGRMETFALASDGNIWHASQSGSGWGALSPLASPPVALLGVPGITTNSDGRLEIFCRGSDGSIWHTWQLAPNGTWGSWYALGSSGAGSFVSDVAAGRNGDGRLEIAATDSAGTLWHAWQYAPSGGWSGFSPLGGAIAGTPGINTNLDGRLEIFGRATSDSSIVHIWQLVPSGGWGDYYSVGGVIGSDATVARNSDGRLEVFAIDTSGNMIHTWQSAPGGGWIGPMLLGAPGYPLTGVPQSATNTDGRVEAIAPDSTTLAQWDISQVAAGGGWTGYTSLGGRVLPY